MNDPQSYPPVFRRQPTHNTTTTTTIDGDLNNGGGDEEATNEKHDPIEAAAAAVIDLERPEVERLREACREWGVFRVVNHGVPESLMDQLKSHAAEFFALPFEYKQALFSGGGGAGTASYFWGTPALTSSGRPLDESAQEINWVEGINVPLCSSQLPTTSCGDSLLRSLSTLVGEYGKHMARISRTAVELMGLERGGEYVSEPTGIIRVYRYPQIPAAGSGEEEEEAAAPPLGMQAHTDSSVASIVLQDDRVSGLEFLQNGAWVPLDPVAGTLVVNVGDMMQAISGDEYKSVKHRVMVKKKKEDRISICYFVFPGDDQIIESSNYRPFTYKEFQQQAQHDIKTLGFKVGLERFRR